MHVTRTISMDLSLLEELKKAAEQKSITVNKYVVESIKNEMKRNEVKFND